MDRRAATCIRSHLLRECNPAAKSETLFDQERRSEVGTAWNLSGVILEETLKAAIEMWWRREKAEKGERREKNGYREREGEGEGECEFVVWRCLREKQHKEGSERRGRDGKRECVQHLDSWNPSRTLVYIPSWTKRSPHRASGSHSTHFCLKIKIKQLIKRNSAHVIKRAHFSLFGRPF